VGPCNQLQIYAMSRSIRSIFRPRRSPCDSHSGGCAIVFCRWIVNDKFQLSTSRSRSVVGDCRGCGVRRNSSGSRHPDGVGTGRAAYGKRLASTAACSGIHSAMAFGLDSALHEDPRYFRSAAGGFWRRGGTCVPAPFSRVRTTEPKPSPCGGFGSAYGAAYLSNQWYPGRLNTVALGFAEGSLQLGSTWPATWHRSFAPDLKRMLFHRK